MKIRNKFQTNEIKNIGFVEILFDFCKNFLKIYFYFYFYLKSIKII